MVNNKKIKKTINSNEKHFIWLLKLIFNIIYNFRMGEGENLTID